MAIEGSPAEARIVRQVDAAWTATGGERPGLRDGEIVALRAEGDLVHLGAELAHRRRSLAQDRRIPLGIVPRRGSAIPCLIGGGDDRLVLGRRASGVPQHPGCWELIPASGIARRAVAGDASVDVEARESPSARLPAGVSSRRCPR